VVGSGTANTQAVLIAKDWSNYSNRQVDTEENKVQATYNSEQVGVACENHHLLDQMSFGSRAANIGDDRL
jgi:hypothetical protein